MCDDYDPEAEDKRDNNPAVILWGKVDGPAGFKAKLVEEFGEEAIQEDNGEYIILVDPAGDLNPEVVTEEQARQVEAELPYTSPEKEWYMRGLREPHQCLGATNPITLEGVRKAEELIEETHRERCSDKKEKMLERIKQLARQHQQEQD